MTQEPHAAFPTAAAIASSSASGFGSGAPSNSTSDTSGIKPSIPASRQIPLPTSSDEIREIILSHIELESIREVLIPHLDEFWAKASSRDGRALETMLGSAVDNLNNLANGDLDRYTVGLIYVLLARLAPVVRSSSSKPDLELFDICSRIANWGNDQQFRLIPARVTQFAQKYLSLAKRCKKVDIALSALEQLLRRATTRGQLSGVHGVYLEACLLTRQYHKASIFIDEPIVEVQEFQPTYLDVLRFYYHAGTIAAAEQKFGNAKEFFSIAVSLPTHTASAIQLAAAKRATLCEILDTGKSIEFPKYTSGVILRMLDKQATQYTKLAKAFEAKQWKMVDEHARAKVFTEDCNAGLVQQILACMVRWKILKVRETYSRLAIGQLAQKIGETDTIAVLHALQTMISTGMLNASIDTSSSPIITFLNDHPHLLPTTLPNLHFANYLATVIEKELAYGNRDLGVDRKYLQKQVHALEIAGGKGSGKGGKLDDFEQLIAAEEASGSRAPRKGGKVGNDHGDAGF